jgi:poly(3-hydroxybutyrate) depolymerase
MKNYIRISKNITVYSLTFILLSFIAGCYVLPKGPKITSQNSLNSGKDTFAIYAYKDSKRKSIRVWTYRPESWKNQDKIVFVMHGGGRNANDYLNAWVELAEENNLLIIAPEFDNKFKNITTRDYQEGNVFKFFGNKNPKSKWAYTVVENIFDHIKSVNNITNSHYDIFGHSAGGQFVHRMVMLMPESRIKTAIAANAGFYSFPDKHLAYPYGIKKTGITLDNEIQSAYKKRLIVLLGELDNDPSLGTFRQTKKAMQQGANRLERGTNFFNANKKLSEQKEWLFNWKIDTVKNVGHNYKEMSEKSIEWINN